MEIVLSILQIIGIILLVILSLAILLVLIALFSPIKYRIDAESQDTVWAKAKAHWLYRMVGAKVSYENNLLYGEVRIFFKKITFSHDFTEQNNVKDNQKSKDEVKENETPETETKESTENESMIPKIKGIIERIKTNYPRFKKMISDEKNKEAVAHIKKELIYIVKIMLPKKSKVDAVFSTGSPDTTGQIYGVMACFPIIYSKDWSLMPDFQSDEPYFKGMVFGKGKFYLFQIALSMLRIVFDKKCRRLYNIVNQFLKLLKEDTNQEVK